VKKARTCVAVKKKSSAMGLLAALIAHSEHCVWVAAPIVLQTR